eukprot:14791148-Ditylum_brightwellii.AAC.1
MITGSECVGSLDGSVTKSDLPSSPTASGDANHDCQFNTSEDGMVAGSESGGSLCRSVVKSDSPSEGAGSVISVGSDQELPLKENTDSVCESTCTA